mmetsp:Transcript_12760/g.14650  ORF Transcript_12760/g.14650 Transcript_12760/m.14650 type:complete len:99 (+) Transcript_12760:46-342(+)
MKVHSPANEEGESAPPPPQPSPKETVPPRLMAPSVTTYVQRHQVHLLLDRLVKDLLVEKPMDSDAWMLRWLLEQHRQACAKKHLHATPSGTEDTTPSE